MAERASVKVMDDPVHDLDIKCNKQIPYHLPVTVQACTDPLTEVANVTGSSFASYFPNFLFKLFLKARPKDLAIRRGSVTALQGQKIVNVRPFRPQGLARRGGVKLALASLLAPPDKWERDR